MAGGRGARSGAQAATLDRALADYRATFTDDRWQVYLDLHGRRYQHLLGLVLELSSSLSLGTSGLRILDIGPRFEVDLLHRVLPSATVDTLGINAGLFPLRDGESHFRLDLNEVSVAARRPELGPFDLVVMAEVLEHLHTAPSIVLPWIGSLLVAGGCLLIQTPNAVALPKRLRMLLGIHPFRPLSTDPAYPGHYREYSVGELVAEGRSAGLEVVRVQAANYFTSSKRSNRLFQRLERVVPMTMRAGITVIYRRPT